MLPIPQGQLIKRVLSTELDKTGLLSCAVYVYLNVYMFIFSYNLTVHQDLELWNMMLSLCSIDVLL